MAVNKNMRLRDYAETMLSKSAVGCHLSLCVAKHMPEVIFHLLEQFAFLLIY